MSWPANKALQVITQPGGSQTVKTPEGLLRFAGVTLRRDVAIAQSFIGDLGGAQSTSARSWFAKVSAPCDFDAVQIVVGHVGATTPTIKGLVAATETAANDTAANRFNPIVGGTAYMTIDSTNEQYGFKSMKWAAAATKAFAGTGTRYNPELLITDLIPASSVPRADIPGANPLLLLRIYNDGSAQSIAFASDPGFANLRAAGGANGSQILQCAFDTGNDDIAVPGSNPGTLGTSTLLIGVIFYSRKSGASYITIGDSITENDDLVADKLSSWGLRAADAVSTQSAPVAYVNAGCSGKTSTAYLASGLAALAALKPSVAHYSAYSPNDYPGSGAATLPILRNRIEKMASNLQVFLDYCAKNRIVPIVSTGIPNPHDLTVTGTDALRKAYNDSLRARAASGQFILCDFDAAIADNSSTPATIQAAYSFGDGVHPNEAGVAVMGTIASAALRQALY